jgi:hypothetical protein
MSDFIYSKIFTKDKIINLPENSIGIKIILVNYLDIDNANCVVSFYVNRSDLSIIKLDICLEFDIGTGTIDRELRNNLEFLYKKDKTNFFVLKHPQMKLNWWERLF